MITIGIGALIIAVIIIAFRKHMKSVTDDEYSQLDEEQTYAYDTKSQLHVFIGVIVAFAMLFLAFLLPSGVTFKEVFVEKVSLHSMVDDSQVFGDVSLYSGYIGEELYYSFYTKKKDGTYKPHKIEAYYTTLKQHNGREGYIELYQNVLDKKPNYLWSICSKGARNTIPFGSQYYSKIVIYVPEGSIKPGYRFDGI